MASKCSPTPSFEKMIAARGGTGATSGGGGKKMPMPAKTMPKGGNVKDTDHDKM